MHSTFPELDLKNINIPELFENSLPPGDRFIPTSAKMPKKKFQFLGARATSWKIVSTAVNITNYCKLSPSCNFNFISFFPDR